MERPGRSDGRRTLSARGEDGGAPIARPTLSRGMHAAFLAFTLLVPFLVFGAVEGALRLFAPGGGLPLFVEAPFAGEGYLVANQRVGARYFPAEEFPPAPPGEPFAAVKPERGLRVFVLGESSTAGFPFPHNGTFSRVLGDALGDVLPDDSVEVVNLGLAATNSFTLVDIIDELLEQDPDMVLVYAGHNEYYGALGVGSTQSGWASSPSIKRAYLALLRLRSAQLLRSALARVRGGAPAAEGESRAAAATMMEVLARDQQIELGGETYRRGVRQFEENLAILADRCREAGVPLFVASVASNVRDQRPLVSPGNTGPAGADSTYAAARSALAAGDSARARELFGRARDLDVVRFRAPGELNEVIRRVAAGSGARYVPVAERFGEASGGMPGETLFLEHVHPTRRGQVLIARTFFEAIREAGFAGRQARPERLRAWESYEDRMALTPFDLRVVHHTIQTLATQWPFVPADRGSDYRGSYRPVGLVDSLAMQVSRGGLPWGVAKMAVASSYEERGAVDSAAAEYRGLVRDAPFAEPPLRLMGRALLAAGHTAQAESLLVRANELEPTYFSNVTLGRLAVERRDPVRAVHYLERAVGMDPSDPVALYSLSLAYGMNLELERARATAERLTALAPDFPGLAEWRGVLGLRR